MSNSGVLVLEPGAAAIASGVIELQDGPLLKIDAGAKVSAFGPVVLGATAILFGNGEIQAAALDNTGGIIRPGDGNFSRDSKGAYFDPVPDSIGKLTISLGQFYQSQNAVLEIEIGGREPESEYDVLEFQGTAALGGVLRVLLKDGFAPQLGDAFTVLSASALENDFSHFELPALPSGLTWDKAKVAAGYRLQVVPEPSSLALAILAIMALLRSRAITARRLRRPATVIEK